MSRLKKLTRLKMSEKQRTVVLLVLLAFALWFIYWTRNQYSTNFLDTF